ncbi:headcase protein [Aplysia californica]|uniref:Headcase protein n=1 Tax=Aplysia californica TaxID=6500 RepID=A0ABM0K951_APLCA|nr:headcase protein [Aplysia californica]
MVKRQQEEMARHRQEVARQYQQKQQQAAQARRQVEARAAAEAELRAQQEKAKYEANMRAYARAQAATVAKMAQANQQALQNPSVNMPQPGQTMGQPTAQTSTNRPASNSFLDNFTGGAQTAITTGQNNVNNVNNLVQPPTAPTNQNTQGFFSASKNDPLSGSIANQVDSFASANPYSVAAAQQNVYSKLQPTSLPNRPQYIPNTNFPQQPLAPSPQFSNVAPRFQPINKNVNYNAPPNLPSLSQPRQPAGAFYPQRPMVAAGVPSPYQTATRYPSLYSAQQASWQRQTANQRQAGPMDQYMMYHMFQTAA